MKKILGMVLAGVVLFSIGPTALVGLMSKLNPFKLLMAELGAGKTQFTQGPPKVSVERLNELVSLRIRIKTLLSASNNWYKGIWEVEGDALFGADCRRAEWSSIDQEHKRITLRIPRPRVIMARVDHQSTRLYDFRSISWNPAQLIWGNPQEMREEAMKHAQSKLEDVASDEENLSQAVQQAEYNLQTFYSAVGWNLTVEWVS